MRSDNNLGEGLSKSEAWETDSVTGKDGKQLSRFQIPSLERAKMSFSGSERNHLFLNSNGRKYTDVSPISGLDTPSDSRGYAICDLDRDGLQDIILTNTNAPILSIYKNKFGSQVEPNDLNFIAFRTVGGSKSDQPNDSFSNRDGIGAIVKLRFEDSTMIRERRCGEGLAAQNSGLLHFGIGQCKSIPQVEVVWPSGVIQKFRDVEAGNLVTVYEDIVESPGKTGFETQDYVAKKRMVSNASRKPSPKFRNNLSSDAIHVFVSMATWCDNCKKHLEQLQILRDSFPETELNLIAVPVDPADDEANLIEYQSRYEPAYGLIQRASYSDREKFSRTVQQYLHHNLFPASIITSGDGTILDVVANVPSKSDIRRAQQQLLSK